MAGFFYGDLPPSLQKSYANDPRTAIAQQLLQQGTATTPLRGGATEGVLRLANALLGGYQRRKLGEEYTQKGNQYNTALASALAGVKPGHYETGADGTPQYVNTDISSINQAAQQTPGLQPLAQQFQLAGIQGSFDNDAAALRAQAAANFRTPSVTNINGRVFIDGKDTGQVIPKQYDPESAAYHREMADIARMNAETNRQNAGNRPPPIIVDPATGTLRYADIGGSPVAGLQAPPKGGATYSQLTPEEVRAAGLQPGNYQKSSAGKIEPVSTGGGGSAQASQRAQLVVGSANNALARLAEIQQRGAPTVSPYFGVESNGVVNNLMHEAGRAFLTDEQKTNDATYAALVDEAIPALTGGLRGSDAFRRFLIGQLPKKGDSEASAKEKLRVFGENVQGIKNTFSANFKTNPNFQAPGEPATTGVPAAVVAPPAPAGLPPGAKFLGFE